MTAGFLSRTTTCTVSVLNGAGTEVAVVDIKREIQQFALQSNSLDTRQPNGRVSWTGQIELAGQPASYSLDSRNTSGSPSGAEIWARGNRINLSFADTSDTIRAFPSQLYILAVPQPPTPGDNRITVSVGDQLELGNFNQPEGDQSEITRGTETNRKDIINAILAANSFPAVAVGDTLLDYPLNVSPQKTDVGAWINFCGGLAATAGYALWQDSTGDIRLTQINLSQAAPAFAVTIGVDERSFNLFNQDERPPETLEVRGAGYDTTEAVFPRVTETWQYTTKGALLGTSDDDEVVGQYDRTTETLSGNTVTVVTVTQVPKIIISPDTVVSQTSLRVARRITERQTYRIDDNAILRTNKNQSVARGYANQILGSEEFTTNLLDEENDFLDETIEYIYDANTGLLKRIEARVDGIRASLGAQLTPATTVERTEERIDKWTKKGEKGQWRFDRIVRQTAQQVYGGDNLQNMSPYALVPNPSASRSTQTNDGQATPPQTQRLPDLYNSEPKTFSGSAKFTPISGVVPLQQKLDVVDIQGAFCVSDAQCAFLATLLGKIRQGRSLAAQYTGLIPDWFLTSYQPMPRVDVTYNGITTAYLADGISIALTQSEAAMSTYLIELGTVGATPAAVTPRYTQTAVITDTIVFTDTIRPSISLTADPITDTILFTDTIVGSPAYRLIGGAVAGATVVSGVQAEADLIGGAVAGAVVVTPGGQSANLIGGAVAGAVAENAGTLGADLIGGAVAGAVMTTPGAVGANLIGGAVAGAVAITPGGQSANLIGGAVAGATVTSGTWSPLDVPLFAFFDPRDAADFNESGGFIDQWDNLATSNNATASSTARPSRVTGVLNGNAVVRFDGSNDRMTLGTNILNTSGATASIFVVAKYNDTSGDNALISNRTDSSNGFTLRYSSATGLLYFHTGETPNLSRTITNQFNLIQVQRNGLSVAVGDNGTIGSSSTISGYDTSSTFYIGSETSGGGSYLKGDIAMIIITDGLLGTSDRQKMEGWICHELGIEALLDAGHPYKSAPP